jgi:hypothetical protein
MLRAITLTAVLAGAALAADDPIFSGPQVGEKLTACKVRGVLGTRAGKEVELIAELKGAPTVLVFVHELTRPARQALLPIDHCGVKWAKDGLATQFIWLSGDRAKTEEYLKSAARSVGLQSPVGISMDGKEGPGNYGLNRKVTLTILVAKDNKVVANHAIVQPNETDAPKVLADIAKILGKPAPTAEELRALREATGKRPIDEPEGAQTVREGMRGLLRETEKAKIEKQFKAMDDWAGTDRKKVTWLRGYLGLVFEKSKYGTKEVQESYSAWKKSKSEKK